MELFGSVVVGDHGLVLIAIDTVPLVGGTSPRGGGGKFFEITKLSASVIELYTKVRNTFLERKQVMTITARMRSVPAPLRGPKCII